MKKTRKNSSASPRKGAISKETSSVERTREGLLQAARSLFCRKGYAATTVKEIADEAGVNISLISYHFNGKEGIYRTCLNAFAETRRELAQQVLRSPANAGEFRLKLQLFIEEMIRLFLKDNEMTKIIHRDIEIEVPAVEEVFRTTMLPIFQTLVDFIAAAQKKGFARRSDDPVSVAGTIFGSMVHAMRSEPLSKKYFNRSLADAEYRKRLVTTMVNVFCDGLISEG